MSKAYRWVTLGLSVWLVVWMVLSWPGIQDDALIHLRYANELLHHHFVTYDGVHRTFGASSLLYIMILAALRSVFLSPDLPRAVSTVCHGVLFAWLAVELWRRLQGASAVAWSLAMLLLACLASPSSLRWLEDGMETSLVLCFMTGLVLLLRAASRRSSTWAPMIGLLVLGFFTELLRIEMLMLLGFSSVMVLLARRDTRTYDEPEEPFGKSFVAAAAPLLGGLVAAGLIVLVMHTLLPDTALAKEHDSDGPIGILIQTKDVFISSMSLGLGMLAVEVLSFIALWQKRRRLPLPALVANLVFPVVLLMAVARAQSVQGIRYFTWTLYFPILWNLLALATPERSAAGQPITPNVHPRWMRAAIFGLSVIMVAFYAVESPLFLHLFRMRAGALAEFRSEDLGQLHNLRLTAGDVGYIGYFTQAPVCDIYGLVDGRGPAKLTTPERNTRCAAKHPQIAFVAAFQMGPLLSQIPDGHKWSICSYYDLGNLRSNERHYLLASPAVTQEVCSATHHTPVPVDTIWTP